MAVRIPIIAVVTAIPKAVRAAKLVAADDKRASSHGGAQVTAKEVAEAVAAFTTALAEEVLPAILAANGCDPKVK
jgi:PPE-repeat protein